MSKSYRDRRVYELRHHNEVCTDMVRVPGVRFYARSQGCVCDGWHDYHCYDFPPPSYWNRECRQSERTSLRRVMVLGINGHKDWDDLPAAQGRVYRRPYYW
ncbi:hypothetical protein R2361_14390 [Mycobacteroides chelonae]|uniref:hypothetical protein n=1 Tax=Mycobacteroides chelonae TaxID=1774 RepID=UPI002DEF14C1|nr:hypothetical protein [Mycobacteroides chelonae]